MPKQPNKQPLNSEPVKAPEVAPEVAPKAAPEPELKQPSEPVKKISKLPHGATVEDN